MANRLIQSMMDRSQLYKSGSDMNNTVPVRNVYGAATGNTLGQVSAPMSPASLSGTYSQAPSSADNPTQGEPAASGGGALGQPLTWLVILALLLVGFKFLSQKAGDGGQFANLKVTIWNVVLIALAATVGIAFFKVIFGRIRIPGLSDLVAAV